MIFLRIKFFLLGSLCLSYGDVSNLLKPINFNGAGTNNSITGTHSSALIAPKSSTSGFPRYRSEANTDREISLGISEIEQKLSISLQNRYQSGGTISVKLTRSWVPLKVTSKFVFSDKPVRTKSSPACNASRILTDCSGYAWVLWSLRSATNRFLKKSAVSSKAR